MTSQIFINYFSDLKIIKPLDDNRTRTLWIDFCRIHNESEELLKALTFSRTELKRFRPNGTSTAQPFDQLLLRSFKAEWTKRWDKKRNEKVQEGEFTSAGRVRNPGKYFFLKLVKEVVDEFNERTIGNISFSRKSLMMCGLISGENGVWEVGQLTDELQQVVKSYVQYFNGQELST